MHAIATYDLCKSYGPKRALCNLNLTVPTGRRFGFLGPNGAGKTTTIRILLGLLRATCGRAELLGCDPWRDGPRSRTQVGYLPGDVRFYGGKTGRATLELFASARGVNVRAEVARLATRLDLDLDRRVRDYSRGMKQKLGLIQALMHRPAVLILDEPTISLDPLMRTVLYGELRQLAAEGHTVLFSSHTLSEVEELCDEVAILRDGRLVEQERIEVLRQRAVRRVEVAFAPQRAPSDPPPGLQIEHCRDGRLSGTWSGPPEALLTWLARGGVRDVTIAPPALEDLFLAYYQDGETAEAQRAQRTQSSNE